MTAGDGRQGAGGGSIPAEFLNQVVTGDARLLASRIPDASVDLCFTDPVYERLEDYYWLGREAVRVLKPDSACLVFCGIQWLPESVEALKAGGLSYRWTLIAGKPQGIRGQRFCSRGFSNYQACLWMESGRSLPDQHIADLVFSHDAGGLTHTAWGKNVAPSRHWLYRFTRPAAVVWDPFAGGGTIPAICVSTGRNFIASEIDAEAAQKARRRVLDTIPPLLLPEPEPHPMLELAEAAP